MTPVAASDRDPSDVALGRKLRALRALTGLHLRDVAERLPRLSESSLSAYELGKRTPRLPTLRRLAHLYGVEPAELMPSVAEVEAVQASMIVEEQQLHLELVGCEA